MTQKPYLYVAWEDKLHDWSSKNDCSYLFKAGYCSGTYDRVNRLNTGWQKAGGVFENPCLYLSEWTELCRHEVDSVDEAKAIERRFNHWMQGRNSIQTMDEYFKQLGKESCGGGSTEIYRLSSDQIPKLIELNPSDWFGPFALDAVKQHIESKSENV